MKWVYGVLALSLGWSVSSHAWDQGSFDADSWGAERGKENKHLSGRWQDRAQWSGLLCDGSYDYDVTVTAELDSLKFEIADTGEMFAFADVRDIRGRMTGNYTSEASLCLPLWGKFGASADSAKIKSRITFKGEGESLEDMQLEVLSTQLGTVHVGSAVPEFLEQFLTRQLERGLKWVWKNDLGGWLSARITELVKSKIPKDPHSIH